MINPALLCKKHLLGEHGEIHKHRHNFVKGHSIEGRRGQIEPDKMEERHGELASEMIRRKMDHKSPYVQPDLSGYSLKGFTVDTKASIDELIKRCPECRMRIELISV